MDDNTAAAIGGIINDIAHLTLDANKIKGTDPKERVVDDVLFGLHWALGLLYTAHNRVSFLEVGPIKVMEWAKSIVRKKKLHKVSGLKLVPILPIEKANES